MKTCALLTGIAALFLATSVAQAIENGTTLTLACEGTINHGGLFGDDPAQRESISMGIIVNFTNKTVHGFDSAMFGIKEEPAKITGITETAINFGSDNFGSDEPHAALNSLIGVIDRVTGDVWASSESRVINSCSNSISSSISSMYELKCKPTQRMF
jgi:hypothetical protein